MSDYKVRWYSDDEYQVTKPVYGDEYYYGEGEETIFKGSLSDCESFIRLKEGGYFD